jgi:organic radical activating enzyme
MSLINERESLVATGHYLPLMEDFYTIQGEGFHTGTPSYFIRVGGCDVGCHWCDVKESWDAAKHPPTSIDVIAERAQEIQSNTGCSKIVITGGEPATYNMTPLTEVLRKEGFIIHLETSGAYGFSGLWDWICLSPKKTAPPTSEWYQAAHELKVIIYNKYDFKWAEEHAAKVNGQCKLFLQPEWSKREKMTPELVNYVMANPKWNISLQTHKFLNIP